MKLKDIRQQTQSLLLKAGVVPANFETDVIIQTALNINKTQLISKLEQEISIQDAEMISSLSEKRASGYPLQYIVGSWDFYGREFLVGEGVLIPRADTETLIDTAKKLFSPKQNITAVDLCSGSGCIGITIEKELNAKVYALEKSEQAFGYLIKNIKLNDSSTTPLICDVLNKEYLLHVPKADLIISNPPYIKTEEIKTLSVEVSFEPEMALDGADDGLKFYKGITSLWKQKLKKGGYLLYEIGYTQAQDVIEILKQNGFYDVKVVNDLCDNPRVVYGRKL